MDEVPLGVVSHGIAKDQLNIRYQMLKGVVLAHDRLRMYRPQIHRPGDDGMVVLEFHCGGVDRATEWSRRSMRQDVVLEHISNLNCRAYRLALRQQRSVPHSRNIGLPVLILSSSCTTGSGGSRRGGSRRGGSNGSATRSSSISRGIAAGSENIGSSGCSFLAKQGGPALEMPGDVDPMQPNSFLDPQIAIEDGRTNHDGLVMIHRQIRSQRPIGGRRGVRLGVPLEAVIVETRYISHHPGLDRTAEAVMIPRYEAISRRRPLALRMIPKDERVASDGRACPDMSSFVAPRTSTGEVGHQHLVIDLRPAGTRSEVSHRVQVRDVDALGLPLDGTGIGINLVVAVVLLHVHAKDANVHPIDSLEERQGLGMIGDDRRWCDERRPAIMTNGTRASKQRPASLGP
mmetsp:Transcript_31372/g.91940  ORF Transcript_31372/g.91940 Transcript_31372/m.91940 type:complete len:402 (+) Transcript_31372:1666-2871(+)